QAVSGHTLIRADDMLLLKGEPSALEQIVAEAKLKLVTDEQDKPTDTPTDDVGIMEAVVTEDSWLRDRTPSEMRLYDRYGINVLAVSRSGTRITDPMRSLRLRAGDVIVLRGEMKNMPDTLGELRLLPLAERGLALGNSRRSLLPILVLAAAMLLLVFDVLPVAVAFFAAAVTLLLLRSISLKEAYETVEWPILILIGCLIPVSDALRTTGGTELIAGFLSMAAHQLPPLGALALIMVAAMAITPFLNNAA